MTTVEVKFSGFSSKHNARPGDVKKVPAEDVAGLESDGIAVPTSKKEVEKASEKAQ
jgi:hypothetical protein